MIGSRPLTSEEIARVLKTFSGAYAARDRALFILGLKSGFRISEMLSLKVSDVWKDGKVSEAVSVAQKRMKGKVAARRVPLNPEAARAIQDWLDVLGMHRPDAPLFESQRKGKAIDRTQAYRILEGCLRCRRVDREAGHPCDAEDVRSWGL